MTARDRVLANLSPMNWVGWQTLQQIGGVRYSARLLELKRLGYQIEDRPDHSGSGKDYRLLSMQPSTPQAKTVKVYLPEPDVVAIIGGTVTNSAAKICMAALRTFQMNKHKL